MVKSKVNFYAKDEAQYSQLQQGILTAVEGSLRIASTDTDAGEMLAISWKTEKGPVCYLVSAQELQDAINGSLQTPSDSRSTGSSRSIEEKTSESIRGQMGKIEKDRFKSSAYDPNA